jgi:hypothetical protein
MLLLGSSASSVSTNFVQKAIRAKDEFPTKLPLASSNSAAVALACNPH